MKSGVWPDLKKMQQTIKEAGYTPVGEEIRLRVSGKVVKEADAVLIEVDGMSSPIKLRLTAAKEEAEALAHLERHAGETVEIEGKWQAAEDPKDPGSLAVTRTLKAGGAKSG